MGDNQNDNDDLSDDARDDDAGSAGWSGPTPADEVPAEASADESVEDGDE